MTGHRTSNERRYVPGDWIQTEGKRAVALESPHVHVLYEDGMIERRPLHCTCRIDEQPAITVEQINAARARRAEPPSGVPTEANEHAGMLYSTMAMVSNPTVAETMRRAARYLEGLSPTKVAGCDPCQTPIACSSVGYCVKDARSAVETVAGCDPCQTPIACGSVGYCVKDARAADETSALPLCDCTGKTGCKELRADQFRCQNEEAESESVTP